MALTVETGTTLLYTAVTGCKSKRILMTFVALIYLALLIALANLELQRSAPIRLVTLLSLALPAAAVILVINSAFDLANVTLGTERRQLALILLPIGFAASVLIFALTVSDRPLRGIARLIRIVSAFEVTFFDQQNRLHRLATALVILALLALTWRTTSGNLALGTSGLSDTHTAFSQLVVNALINTSAALLGIGFLIRRDWRETLIRLGLRQPQRRDCLAGATMALALFFLVAMATSVWQSLVSPTTFEAQTPCLAKNFCGLQQLIGTGIAAIIECWFQRGDSFSRCATAGVWFIDNLAAFCRHSFAICLYAGDSNSVYRVASFGMAAHQVRYNGIYHRAQLIQFYSVSYLRQSFLKLKAADDREYP